jgi:uncharacterized membrane protein YoaK (UPF0700 family)
MADQDNRPELSPGAFALGMVLGAVIGFALWIGTDTFALFPAFLGVGVVFGMIFSAQRGGRGKDDS